MIKEMVIDGRKKMVFLLEEGPAAYIVIPFDSINHTDYKRLKDLAATGKDLMKAMLDTKLENGKNCLQLYQNIIKVVYKIAPAQPVLAHGTTKQSEAGQAPAAAPAPARKPGRPRKAVTAPVPGTVPGQPA